MNRRRASALAAAGAIGLLVSACSTPVSGHGSGSRAVTSTPVVRPQYAALVDVVASHAARVWIETDLLKAWVAGPARYREVLQTVVSLAGRPGVDGVKIADELGYDDGMDAARTRAFLAETTAALHQQLPGRKVMVDMIVPELGCLAWRAVSVTAGMRSCAAAQTAKNPAATIAAVDTYLQLGGLDALNLSAGLRSDGEYESWGTSRDAAMTAIWVEAKRRWGGLVTLQARKALAHPGTYPGTVAEAERDVHTFVDIPIANGAAAVDIWSWSQHYKDATYQLSDPGLKDNALIEALHARTAEGVHLWTHMTPSSLQQGLDQDVASATKTFTTILVASGTG